MGNRPKFKKTLLAASLAAGLALTAPAAHADALSDILGALQKIVSVVIDQLKAAVDQIQAIADEGSKNRDLESAQQAENRQQQEAIWGGSAMPPGTAGDVAAPGTPGGINRTASNQQAKQAAQVKAIATQLDAPPSLSQHYADVASWMQGASPEDRAKVLTPTTFSPGETLSDDQRAAADKNCKLVSGVTPAQDLPDAVLKTTAGQEYVAKRAQLNAVQASAYDACRKYDMSAEEMAEYQATLTQFTPDYINGLNAGSSIKTQLQLTAIMARMQLSMYAGDLRRERMLSIQTAQSSSEELRRKLNQLRKDMPLSIGKGASQ